MSAPLLLAARRSGADAGCGFSAPRGRTFAYGPSAPTRLHDTRTDTQSLRSAPRQSAFTLRLDSSSRFYVFDQDLTDASRDYGASIGRACAPDVSVLNGAATAYCGPIIVTGRPPPLCSHNAPNPLRISIADVPRYCGLGWLTNPLDPVCPSSQFGCNDRCDFHLPVECIQLRPSESVVSHRHMVVPRYDRGLPVNWARLPYTLGADGDDEVVQLVTPNGQPWPAQPRSVRNYDLGICGAFVTYQALATLVNDQFFPQYAASVFTARRMDGSLQVLSAERLLTELKVGPVLQGNIVANNDLVSMWFRTDADVEVPDFTLGQAVYPTSNVFARLRVTTVSPQNMPGVWRLSIGGQIEPGLTWNVGGDRDPDVSLSVARALEGTATAPGIGASIADAVTRMFLQPIPLGPARPDGVDSSLRCERGLIGTPEGVASCLGQTLVSDLASGPEFGCYDEAQFSTAAQAARRLDIDRINTDTNEVRGVCATRLQARRVNVLPDELEIVLAEQEDDPSVEGLAGRQQMTRFLRRAIAASPEGFGPGIRIACDDKDGAGWNPVPQPGRIAQSGTLGVPTTSIRRCDGQQACGAFRPAVP